MIIGISGYIGSGKDTVAKMIQGCFHYEDMGIKDEYFIEGVLAFVKSGELQYDSRWPNRWQVKKFAGKLKQMVSLLIGISVEDLEKPEVKNSQLGEEWETFISLDEVTKTGTGRRPLTVRELLQRLGTEAVRNQVHPNSWVNALMVDYVPHIEGRKTPQLSGGIGGGSVVGVPVWPNWIITDCRFENEAQAIKDRGGIVVRIDRVTQEDSDLYNLTGFPKSRHSSETALKNYEFDYYINNGGTLENLLEETKEMLKHFNL